MHAWGYGPRLKAGATWILICVLIFYFFAGAIFESDFIASGAGAGVLEA
jgi:hypothetical protein